MRSIRDSAEYWVPEDFMFKSAMECLEKFPDNGPACGVVTSVTLAQLDEAMEEKLDELASEKAYQDVGDHGDFFVLGFRACFKIMRADLEKLIKLFEELEPIIPNQPNMYVFDGLKEKYFGENKC